MMQHQSISDLAKLARISPDTPGALRALRRDRLERFASLLEQHGRPVRLLSRLEYLPKAERALLRADNSVLTVAYEDPVFRAQGLSSDRFGDVMDFFHLTSREAHHLFCDCHYTGMVSSGMIAARARSVARTLSFGEIWGTVRHAVSAIWGR
jgi:hypothetical protein